MRKIVQITTTLVRMRPDPELGVGPAAPEVVRETRILCSFLLQDLREKRHFRRLARKLTMFVALSFFYESALLVDRDISAHLFGAISSDSSAISETELSTLGMFHRSVNSEGVGGFQTYFLRSSARGAAELAKVNLMRSYGWIDDQTRSVEIVMPMYNLHLKTCSVVRLAIGFDLTGGVTTSSAIHVMSMQAYNLHVSGNLARFIYEILYAVLVGYFIAMEVWNIFMVAHGNLRKDAARSGLFETMSELASIMTNMIVVVSRWLAMTSPKRKLMRTVPSLDNYAPLLDPAEQDDLYVTINIMNVLILMIRVLKCFQVADGGKRLLNSIASAVLDIASFTPIYVAVMICYAFAGRLLFGLTFPEWSTYTKAFCRVLEMNFGLYDPGPVYGASSFLGFIYISSTSMIFCIIMFNVFMAIIMSTWDVFTEKELEKTNIREKYREKMSFGELIGLIFLHESILNSLIASVLKMGEHDAVNKQVFDQNWRASDPTLIMPSWARARILRWYWNSDNTPHVGPTAEHALQKSGSTPTHAGASGPPPLGSPSSHSLLHSKNNNTSESAHQRKMMHSTARMMPTQQFDQQ